MREFPENIMQTFTEKELGFAKVDGVGSIVLLKRARTREPYDIWYVVEQVERLGGCRKRITRTHTDLLKANDEYQDRLALMKKRGAGSKRANS